MLSPILKNLSNKRTCKPSHARGFEQIEIDITILGTATDIKSTK